MGGTVAQVDVPQRRLARPDGLPVSIPRPVRLVALSVDGH
jgi:hypothetical protein